MPKYKWYEIYKKDNDQPYGLKVFYDLLDGQKNEVHNIKNNFEENLDTNAVNANYIVFGAYLYIDSLRADHILKFAEKGNTVFIASNSAPLKLTRMNVPVNDSIYGYNYHYDSLVTVSFDTKTKEKYSFHHQNLKDTTIYDWSYYSKSYFNDTLVNYDFEPLSYLNENINCYYFKYGKGKIILHSNPILFTNYHIIQKAGLKHANQILSELNSGDIYWDEVSQKNTKTFNNSGLSTGNPLQFLFSHYTLKWGWYLFLVSIIIYLFFRSKREQRIIPIMPKNINSTIEYTKAVGVLYFQKGQHKLIANEMYLIFLASLRNKYNIIITLEDKEIRSQVSAKSGIDPKKIDTLFKLFKNVRFSPMANSKDLINLHHAVEYYYKNCK